MKNLVEVFTGKKLTTLAQKAVFLRDKRLVVIGPITNGANVIDGEILLFDRAATVSGANIRSAINESLGSGTTRTTSVSFANLMLQKDVVITLESLKESISETEEDMKKLKELIADYRIKIKFMKEKGLSKFDEEVFKTYRILNEIEANRDNLDSYKLAEVITKLVKG